MKLFATSSSRNIRLSKLAVIGCTLIILSTLLIVTDPVEMIVNSQLSLRVGTLLYNLWLKPPLDVFITVYMFNYTNFDAFTRGIDSKLKVVEVGPYVYQEYLENRNVTFHSNHTVSYTPHRTVKFVPERSVGDPKVDRITVPNIPYMGVTSAAASFSVFAAIAMNALVKKLNTKVILDMTVHEYLWGYDDPLVNLASKFLPNLIHFDRFGLMDRLFDEGHNVVTIKLPEKHSKNTSNHTQNIARDYSIDNWNGEIGFKAWDYKENKNNTDCNTLRGAYDGTLFPRHIVKGETFRIYRKAFCRTLPIVYSHPDKYYGIETYNFKMKDNTFNSSLNDPESSCYCKGNKCLKYGLGNVAPCYYSIPLAVSFPHFFNGDPSLFNSIEGLHPDEAKHGTDIMIQPQLGIPLRGHTRFQVNLLMENIRYDSQLTPFRNMVLPICWAEMGVHDLTVGIKWLLRLLFKICPYTQIGLIVAFMITGLSLIGTSILLYFWIPTPFNAMKSNNCGNGNNGKPSKAKATNIPLLPLLTQPAEKLTKRQIKKMRREYDVMLMPLQRSMQKSLVV